MASASSSFASATARLAPWLAHARRCMYGALDDLVEPNDLDEDFWIDWHVPPHNHDPERDAWVLTLETIELLDLLVIVDYRGGWALILEILEMSVYIELLDKLLPTRVYPKHTIAWADLMTHMRGRGTRLEHAQKLIVAVPDDQHTPVFQETKTAMCEAGKADCSSRVRICLKLDLQALAPDERAADAFHDLARFAVLVQDPARVELSRELARSSDQPDVVGTAFDVERVVITTSGEALTDVMLATIRTIDHCGLFVSALTLGRSQFAPNEMSPATTLEVLRAITLTLRPSAIALSLGRDMDMSVFQAFCSALMASSTINDMTFVGHARNPQYWAWIAYAVFSGDVAHRLQYLHLDVQHLTLDDVTEFQRVLSADDPLACLSPTGATVRDRAIVDVRPNATGLVRTRDDEAELAAVSIEEPHCKNLRVVDDASAGVFVGVLLPGAGLCWVRRDAIVERRVLPPLRAPSSPSLLHRISLEISNDTPLVALLSLIRNVGQLTRILMLYSSQRTVIPDAFLRDVVAACPRLERLDLVMVTVTSFSWLLESRLESLALTHVRCLDANGHTGVLTALGGSGLASSLGELAVFTHLRVLRRLWPDIISVLKHNHRLHRLLVRTESVEMSDDLETLKTELKGYNGQALCVQERPLALRCRLAFLSVCGYNLNLPELDAAMVSIVLAFAARNKRRVCGLMP